MANSVPWAAIRTAAVNPTAVPYTAPPTRPLAAVGGSVIMKNRKINNSGEVTTTHHQLQPVTGPTCQRAVIEWPVAATTAVAAA